VLSDEVDEEDPEVAWVYVSTSMSDPTVFLPKGCHPEITLDCCIVFEEAEIAKVSNILAAVREGALKQSQARLSADCLVGAQEGVFESEDTPTRVVRFCTDRI
jgi:hypothetical protein